MSFEVLMTLSAKRDLEELHDYIARADPPGKANQILDSIEEVMENLVQFPERGAYPQELLDLGIKEFRETFFKSFRVIYRVAGQHVYILLIAGGRRDFQTLLKRRLLR